MSRGTLARWSFRILVVAGGAALLIVGAVAFLLFTTPGARLAVVQARRLGLPVSVREVGGTLRGPLVLNGLRLETGSWTMEADSLLIDARLRDLITDRRLTVRRLLGRGIDLTVGPDAVSGSDDADRAGSPSLALGIELAIDTARLEEVAISLPSEIRVVKAELGLSGRPEEYSLHATGRLRLPERPAARFTLAATGSLTGWHIHEARARVDGGVLTAAGRLGWHPSVSWDLRLRASGVDPAAFGAPATDWTGELTLDTDIAGRLTRAGPVARLVVDTLRGHLRERQVVGSGTVIVDSSRISVPRFALEWGGASLRVSGGVAGDLELDFRIDVPDLGLVLPDATGALRASGTLTGSRASPRLESRFSARHVAYADQRAALITGDVAIDLQSADTLNARIAAADLRLARRSLDTLAISVRGGRAEHSLSIMTSRDSTTLEAQATGGLAGHAWSGALEEVRLAHPRTGAWRRTGRSSHAIVAPDSVVLADALCLASKDARLCGSGAWHREADSRGSLRIDDLPLAVAKPFLPDGWSLSGPLSGRVRLAVPGDSPPRLEARLTPGPGEITYLVRGIPRTLAYRDARIEVSGSSGSLDGSADLALMEPEGDSVGSLAATFRLPDLTTDPSALRDEPVRGRVQARLHNLRPVDQLVERIENLRGDVAIDLALRGTVESPAVLGEVRWRNGVLDVPAFGVELREITVSATGGESGRVVIEGEARSGEGRLTLNGDSPLIPSEEDPSRWTLEGDRFTAMNNERGRVLVSPRVAVEFDGRRTLVEGELDVPEGDVRLREVSEVAVPVSGDVVFADSMQEARDEPRALEARVTVGLGENVSVSGYGFHASLGGNFKVVEQPAEPITATGVIIIEDGVYSAFGQELQIVDGRLTFAGGPIDNPGLSVRATRTTSDSVTVGVLVSGTLRVPLVTFYSEPPLPQRDIIAGLVTGGTLEGAAESTEDPLASARSKLSLEGASLLVKQIGAELDLDEARLESSGSLREASLMAGKYLSPRLYVAYGVSLFDPLRTLQVRYLLSSKWTLVAETGEETTADFLYRIETGD